MAKLSMIQRELKREKLVARHYKKRIELKDIISNVEASAEEKWEAQLKLQKLPASSSSVRYRRRCVLTGRPRGVYRKFGLSRSKLREMAMQGMIPGLRKASW